MALSTEHRSSVLLRGQSSVGDLQLPPLWPWGRVFLGPSRSPVRLTFAVIIAPRALSPRPFIHSQEA